VSTGAAFAGLSPCLARAQSDVHPRLPNVLLLVDNSGSMEYLIPPDPSDPTGVKLMLPGNSNSAAAGSACTGVQGATSMMNRWATLVTVLTGTIPQSSFSCEKVDRSGSSFTTEYAYQAAGNPYDYRYFLPFHRIYSNGCTTGPGSVPANWDWWQWPATPFTYHTSTGQGCTWSGQRADGLLDTFAGRIRFGMMSFDTFPDPGSGAVPGQGIGSAGRTDPTTAAQGMWSYYHDWISGYSGGPVAGMKPASGFPAGCTTPQFYEVGARNQAAPPWEGRLIPFGDPTSDANVPTTNDHIQSQLLAMRPYGATPLAGMLDDANEFLYSDDTSDPTTGHTFGPKDDLFWQGGCRKTYVIVLSDGEPNLDLLGPPDPPKTASPAAAALPHPAQCDRTVTGSCPYLPADETAQKMASTGPVNQRVLTYVIGFAVSNPAALDQLATPPNPKTCDNLNVLTDCVNPPAGLKACCALQKIAYYGGTGHAYFADNPTALKQQLSLVLSQISAGSTARTWPVYTPAGDQNTQGNNLPQPAAGYQFNASFNVVTGVAGAHAPPTGGALWSGNLSRQRYACVSGVSTPQAVAPSLGDDFAANLNLADATRPRKFLTVIGKNVGAHTHGRDHGHGVDNNSAVLSDWTIRPNIPADDGYGTYKPDPMAPTTLSSATAFPGAMASYPGAFGITDNMHECTDSFATTLAGACTEYLVNWEIGGSNTLSSPAIPLSRDPLSSSCPIGTKCSKLGAIYHSTPAVVGPPHEFLSDESYVAYANTPKFAKQPLMLYTATVDGQLHAFKVAANEANPADQVVTDQPLNNELWSFIPPSVLPYFIDNYNNQAILLDGAPVIADVPGQLTALTSPPVLSRTANASSVGWRRVLLAGGGQAGGFYYALDITDPAAPQFLWQLSTDGLGNPLFGSKVPTPAIANVSIDLGGTRTTVPVAILAGGAGPRASLCTNPATSGVLDPTQSAASANDTGNPNNPSTIGNNFTAQATALGCWDRAMNSSRSSANSLMIVRLDTGAVIKHFIGDHYTGGPAPESGGDPNGLDDSSKKNNGFNNVDIAPFPAPLTGIPVAYPGQTGEIADRIYVGDADGVLWRVDVSDPNLANWKVSMAWDAYMISGDTGAIREGVQLAPVVSRDAIGNTVVLFSTGDQDTYSAQPTHTRVWSVTETPALPHKVSQNWWIDFPANDRRMTGPMTLFNSVAYFATFTPMPPGGNVCADGYGSVWAVDYRRPDKNNLPYPLPAFLGAPATTSCPGNGTASVCQDGAAGTIIYGVSVAQTPSCDPAGITSPYFASGGGYQVMWQTGAGSGLTAGGRVSNMTGGLAAGNAKGNGGQTMTVQTPGQGTRIESWASIVE
jgi:type IV pilus assembly protein PilY1